MGSRRGQVRILVTLTYLVMVAVNYLANALPLNVARHRRRLPRRTRACSRRLGSRSR